MPVYKAVDIDKLNADLFQIAKKIKSISRINDDIKFPQDFIDLLSEDKLNANTIKENYIAAVCNLQNTTLDNELITSISHSSFQNGNKNLTYVNLPNVTQLGSSTFYNCKNITYINLPKLTHIGSACFSYCESLTSLYLPALIDVDEDSWGQNFSHCFALKKIYFPSYTGAICSNAFNNDTSLTTLILGANTVCPLQDTTAFNNTPIKSKKGYIYVPKDLIDTYKTTANWSTFANQFRAIEDYPTILEGWDN